MAALAAPGLAMPGGCTLLLNDEAVQCSDNAGCTRFPNSVCDIGNGVCVPKPNFLDAGTEGGALITDASVADQQVAMDTAPADTAGPNDATSSADRDSSTGGTDSLANSNSGCPDLDHNTIMDCRESLVMNPDFATGAAGWVSELGVTQTAPGNAPGNPASGALSIVNNNASSNTGSSMAGSTQCLPARADASYALYAEVIIPGDQDSSTLAGVSLQTFSTADCSGSPNAVVSPSLVAASGASINWQQVQVMLPAPAGTASASVRLVVVKPFTKGPAKGLFDNVLFKAR